MIVRAHNQAIATAEGMSHACLREGGTVWRLHTGAVCSRHTARRSGAQSGEERNSHALHVGKLGAQRVDGACDKEQKDQQGQHRLRSGRGHRLCGGRGH